MRHFFLYCMQLPPMFINQFISILEINDDDTGLDGWRLISMLMIFDAILALKALFIKSRIHVCIDDRMTMVWYRGNTVPGYNGLLFSKDDNLSHLSQRKCGIPFLNKMIIKQQWVGTRWFIDMYTHPFISESVCWQSSPQPNEENRQCLIINVSATRVQAPKQYLQLLFAGENYEHYLRDHSPTSSNPPTTVELSWQK